MQNFLTVRHIFNLILFLMLNLATGNTECLYWFKISPTVLVADILVGAFLGRIVCSTGPLVRICLCPLGPFVPPFKTDWRICQCAEFLQCFSILQAANLA